MIWTAETWMFDLIGDTYHDFRVEATDEFYMINLKPSDANTTYQAYYSHSHAVRKCQWLLVDACMTW